MKTMKLWRIAFMMLAALSLASCSSDDDDKDITKEIIMNVSAEPGVMYDLFDSLGEHPIECMQVMTLADKKVEEVAEPVEKEVKSEADIEYEQQCPIEKYAIAKGGEYLVDADCQVTYADGTPTPEFDKEARIYLENMLDKSHPLWQAGARYQATYAYVLSPLTDEIRLVPSNRSAVLFKNILTESEMAYVQQSMPQGETLHYALILCNVYKRAIQKVEFTIKKK